MTERHYPTGNSPQDIRILAEKLWNAIESVGAGNGSAGSQTKLSQGASSGGGANSYFQPVISVFGRTGSIVAQPGDYNHESLAGLQGGAVGEHYHMTAAQYASLALLVANKFSIQSTIVLNTENITVQVGEQRHNIGTFTVYGTETVYGEDYVFTLR